MIYYYRGITFEWNDEKAIQIWNKHTISMEEACTIFFDENSITEEDTRYNYKEQRMWTIGISNKQRLLTVAWTDRDNIRIITAFMPTKNQIRSYNGY